MIIETIVSTINSSSDPNFAPMGFTPISDHSGLLHPYKGSHTYANLQENGVGVVNIVDDVLLFVETALYSTVPPYDSARYVKVPLLKDANSCYEFRVVDFKKDREPGEVNVKILSPGNILLADAPFRDGLPWIFKPHTTSPTAFLRLNEPAAPQIMLSAI